MARVEIRFPKVVEIPEAVWRMLAGGNRRSNT